MEEFRHELKLLYTQRDEFCYAPEEGENRYEVEDHRPVAVPCPCCKCKTLRGRDEYAICVVCNWEDDGQDDYDADIVRGGPNGQELSLTAGRANYLRIAACSEDALDRVRAPHLEYTGE